MAKMTHKQKVWLARRMRTFQECRRPTVGIFQSAEWDRRAEARRLAQLKRMYG